MERLNFYEFLYFKILPIIENLTGFTISQNISPELVINFIKKIRPVDTGIELIRIGPNKDGGYLVPNDLENIEALFSPGVGYTYEFEKHIAKKGLKIFMADATVSININNQNFNFIKKFIGLDNSDDYINIENWIRNSNIGVNSDLIMQMDIEGAEYENLISLPEDLLKRFRIIIVEFHELSSIFKYHKFQLIKHSFNKLLKYHSVVHLHPNNNSWVRKYKDLEIPDVLEITFLRNDRIAKREPIISLPHKFDVKNDDKDDIKMQEIWYK